MTRLADRIGWTRGEGCQELAEALATYEAVGLSGDLRAGCIEHRLDHVVASKITSFDLVSNIAPIDVDLASVDGVVAAVADGPHSPLAVDVAASLGSALGIKATVATAYHTNEDRSVAEERLERLTASHRDAIATEATASDHAAALVEDLAPNTLVVIGAPGGSWFHRQLFGPGHKMVVAAPNGVVVVRSSPRRCFAAAVDPTGVAIGRHLSVAEALRHLQHATAPVVDEGTLVGLVRRSALQQADGADPVETVMEPPVSVRADEPTTAAFELASFLDHGPVPVVDADGSVIGVLNED